VVHNQLIRFPDIAFFTSPIPLHIAAMVILYGHMSRCDPLKKSTALEDLWMALDMLPRFRWRWERKDLNGGHPLIERLAERVMDINLHQVGPTTNPTLMSEPDWESDVSPQPTMPKSQQSTPTMSHAYASNGAIPGYGQPPRSAGVTASTIPLGNEVGTPDKQLADIPTVLFYPFYPAESQYGIDRLNSQAQADPTGGHLGPTDFGPLLAGVVPAEGSYGCQPSHDSFMLEEKDTNANVSAPAWMNLVCDLLFTGDAAGIH